MLSQLTINKLKREFQYIASRSSGPGGQNVNKVSTKIEIRFNIEKSEILSIAQKEILLIKLGNNLTSEGDLIITSQEFRSQLKNKTNATEKLITMLQKALTPRKSRKSTSPTKSSVKKRLEQKKQRSIIKQNRKETDFD